MGLRSSVRQLAAFCKLVVDVVPKSFLIGFALHDSFLVINKLKVLENVNKNKRKENRRLTIQAHLPQC